MKPPLILAIETATLGGSVSVARGDQPLAEVTGDPDISHSNTLLRDIDRCLKESGSQLKDVEVFACTTGPGSFTGLRIGLATTKALATTLARPCVGIPTLETIAHAAGPSAKTIALLPAGRGELFVQLLSVSAQREVVGLDQPSHLSLANVMKKYEGLTNIILAGPGAHLNSDLIPKNGGRDWTVAPEEKNLAKHVAALAWQKFQSGGGVTAESLAANYVRPSDAELKAAPPEPMSR